MLYNLIITPIETIVGWTFFFFYKKFNMIGPIGAIIGVSLVINFLALPLYNIADSLQEKERKIQKALEYRVKRIKKGFKGDEQFMMLQTYYRQNNYHPLYALRSSLSILIEIPFFIAAYHYLSNCELLRGQAFLFLKDLGTPDHLFSIPIGANSIFYINILPVLMTLINLISGAIYSKEAPAREKIQIYVLAAIFLVLLYNSPSGLVFYWILNNLFSLAKNIIKKLPQPGKVLHFIISGLFILFTITFFVIRPESRIWKKLILVFFTLIISLIPLEIKLLSKIKNYFIKKQIITNETVSRSTFLCFLFSGIGLALLCGVVLPSSVIASSPIEFSFLGKTENPVSYIFTSFVVFTGMFILWPILIYKIFDVKVKKSLSTIFFVFFLLAIFNSFVFKSSYGKLNAFFRFINTVDLAYFPISYFYLPFIVLLVSLFLFNILSDSKYKNIIPTILISICVAELSLGIYKINSINKTFNDYKNNISKNNQNSILNDSIEPFYHLSKTEKNVVVLFLDRAVNVFFDRIINEFPELKPSFDGFVYYPNTLSFGSGTDRGAPAMMGGYEYTPYQMNLRSDTPLVQKHNEATLVIPKLFLDANYNVYVTDPPWPNYEWKGDLSAFDLYPEINVSELVGKYSHEYAMEKGFDLMENPDLKCRTNIRHFAVLEILFPFLREFFYQNCYKEDFFDQHIIDDLSVLYYLPKLTVFDSSKPTYAFIDNETTHSAEYMNAPYYDRLMKEDDSVTYEVKQYHTNVAAYKNVAVWLDYLRANDCYDNTRIIIVADHAVEIGIKEFEEVDKKTMLPEKLNCILLFKDFNDNQPLLTDTTFMTNADTVFLAKKDLPISNINPFTGKELIQEKENGITIYDPYEATLDKKRTQFTIQTDEIYHIFGDVKNPDNWVKLEE